MTDETTPSTDSNTVATVPPDDTIRTDPPVDTSTDTPPADTSEPEEPAAPEPVMKKWYTWKADGSFNVYDSVIEQDETETQPTNSTQWAPPTAVDDNTQIYWDGLGWAFARNIKKVEIEEMRTLAMTKASIGFMNDIATLNGIYTDAERSSWKQQVIDADAVLGGQDASHLLATIATTRSLDVKVLAQRIVDKSTAYNDKYATILANFEKERQDIKAATTVGDLPEITLADLRSYV